MKRSSSNLCTAQQNNHTQEDHIVRVGSDSRGPRLYCTAPHRGLLSYVCTLLVLLQEDLKHKGERQFRRGKDALLWLGVALSTLSFLCCAALA